MRKAEKIAGFAVETFPHMKSTQLEWVVQFRDLPNVRATGASLPEARERLAIKWEKTADAFKAAGLAVPKPIRPRGNKRILDTIRRLAEGHGPEFFRPFAAAVQCQCSEGEVKVK